MCVNTDHDRKKRIASRPCVLSWISREDRAWLKGAFLQRTSRTECRTSGRKVPTFWHYVKSLRQDIQCSWVGSRAESVSMRIQPEAYKPPCYRLCLRASRHPWGEGDAKSLRRAYRSVAEYPGKWVVLLFRDNLNVHDENARCQENTPWFLFIYQENLLIHAKIVRDMSSVHKKRDKRVLFLVYR